jgi:hypothetical protein
MHSAFEGDWGEGEDWEKLGVVDPIPQVVFILCR